VIFLSAGVEAAFVFPAAPLSPPFDGELAVLLPHADVNMSVAAISTNALAFHTLFIR
jgi:hypothetical protein